MSDPFADIPQDPPPTPARMKSWWWRNSPASFESAFGLGLGVLAASVVALISAGALQSGGFNSPTVSAALVGLIVCGFPLGALLLLVSPLLPTANLLRAAPRANPRRCWRRLPPYLYAVVSDVALTLHGQAAEYWAGEYHLANEGNPLVYPVLAFSPWLFLAAAVAWIFLSGAAVAYWPHRAVGWVAAVVSFTHSVGGASWLVRFGWWGWPLAFTHLAVVVWLVRWSRAVGTGVAPHSAPARGEPTVTPEKPPPEPDAATPADVLTPHDDPPPQPSGEPAAEPTPGIVDPRHLPGPEILDPPPPGLPLPES